MAGNNHHPHVLKREIVFCVLVLVIMVEVGVLAQGLLLFNSPNLLASVLPAVVADLTNTQRTDNSLQPLTVSPLLSEAAQDKADDMAAKGYFSHVSPDGTLPWYWFKQVGYNYQYAGENLAINFNDSNDVVNAWMASPMHRANILKQQYTQVGIGIATGMYQGEQTTFVVQFFASPETTASLAAASTNSAKTSPIASVTKSNPLAVAGNDANKTLQSAPPPTELMTTSAGSASPIATTAVPQSEPVATGVPTVLGTETGGPASSATQPTFFQTLMASPFSTANIIFVVIGAFFLSVLIAGFIYRKRLPRMTATIGGLSVVVVVLGFALLNNHFSSGQVRVDPLSAAVFTSIQK
jgi:hypothetical protein